MGDVIVVFKVMPENPEDKENIKKELKRLKPQRLEEEPIAFGLVALKFTIIIPDAEGEIDKIEGKLKSIKNVQDVETVMISRSL